MKIKTFQARLRHAPNRSGFAARGFFAAATMMLAGLTVVGTSTQAGVSTVTDEQITRQILTVQGQEALSLSFGQALLQTPQDLGMAPGPSRPMQVEGEAPQLLASRATGDHGLSAEQILPVAVLEMLDETKTAALPKRRGKAQWQCLAEALYFEARSESVAGQKAVAEVILNRVDSRKYPDTVCGVVEQGAHRRNACQFSYNCDGRPEVYNEPRAYVRAKELALVMVASEERPLTDGATHYHTSAVRPSWSRRLTETARIGSHIFYRDNTVLTRR